MAQALMIVDPQCDFINGALPVPGAETAMGALAEYLKANPAKYALILVTLDFHPWNHCSFEGNGGQWPRHCVAHSRGAAVWPELLDQIHAYGAPVRFLCKGCCPDQEQYSIFQDYSGRQALTALLRDAQVTEVDLCGVAGDVCVLNTLRDGIEMPEAPAWRVLGAFSPSLDGGASLAAFCAEKRICIK